MRVALSLLLAGCAASAPPRATPLDAERAHVDLAQLETGRALLVKKCGGCHATPLPSAHTAVEWPSKIDEMAERSKLNIDQKRAIEQYLVAMTSR